MSRKTQPALPDVLLLSIVQFTDPVASGYYLFALQGKALDAHTYQPNP